MLKADKVEMVKDLSGRFSKVRGMVIAEFRNLDVETVNKLRKKLRDNKIEWKVLKNTLARRAAQGTQVEGLSKDFVGPVAAAMSYEDLSAPAKVLSEFIKDLETIKIRSGFADGQIFDAKGVAALAKLPGIQELRAMLLGVLNQPASKLVRLLNEPGSQIARAIQAKAKAQ